MKIIAISDTHMPTTVKSIPPEIVSILKGADIVVHAGDFASLEAYDEFNSLFNLRAVAGNMDSYELKSVLPERLIFEEEGVRVGVIHGWGSPKQTIENVYSSFIDDDVDLIIFGHTHSTYNDVRGSVLLFNPGSLFDKRFASANSYGEIVVSKGRIESVRIQTVSI
ncbi:MAG: metallophosphoesterase [Pseudomonadota bacterium]